MSAMILSLAGAPSTTLNNWESINWKQVVAHVRLLQMRIAKAFREGKRGKVKSLQRILTNSFYAKLLAVKRVTSNKGAKTPGVDGVKWSTPAKKMEAVRSLKRRGYKTRPLKRIYIPKKQNGKVRPLSIPVMNCRAQQALHLLSLEPISEIIADKNSYGFRPLRSTADAIEQCFNALAKKASAQYILEGDIRSCFDQISHKWLEENTLMDKGILKKWLAAGYIDKKKFHHTTVGTPQGGIISPTILNVTLSGLEKAVKEVARRKDKINVCIYADDFIVTGATKEVLEDKIKPVIESFLKERGLILSTEKTKISHIDEGFDFLGMNLRKYNGKMLIRPAKSSIKRFLASIRDVIKSNKSCSAGDLIRQLNPRIRGWSNYYKHVCSKQTFDYVDHKIFGAIWRWAVRRHCNKSKRWIQSKYYRSIENRNWVFFTKTEDKDGKTAYVDLADARKVPITRHIKVKANATPYDAAYHRYYDKLIAMRKIVRGGKAVPNWWLCWWNLFSPTEGKIGSLTTALERREPSAMKVARSVLGRVAVSNDRGLSDRPKQETELLALAGQLAF